MARQTRKLTALEIKSAPSGKLADGGGLILHKSETGGRWVYRYSFAGSRRDMGLGGYPDVSLADARKARDRWAASIAAGRDPILERDAKLDAERQEMSRTDPTLAEVAEQVFEARKATLRGDGDRGRWFSPLRIHVLPKLGRKRITQIHQSEIRSVLAPIWKAKPATADKAITRLAIIFRQARLIGLDVDPFTVDAAKHMLGDVDHTPVPIPATPWQEIPDLYRRMQENRTLSHMCLQLMILTCVRSDACRGARFDEIDGAVWTVPADRIKGRKGQVRDFRVPMTDAALEIVEACRSITASDYLFPSTGKKVITSGAIIKAMNALGETGRPHGLRTSFRTWVQDTEAVSYDVAETVLGHTIGSKIERSYARSDLLDQRRIAMDKWAAYVTGESAKVVRLRVPCSAPPSK